MLANFKQKHLYFSLGSRLYFFRQDMISLIIKVKENFNDHCYFLLLVLRGF